MERNLQSEQRAIGVFGQKYGRKPDLNNPEERSQVYSTAYPSGIPPELKVAVDESAGAGGLSPSVSPNPNQSLSGLAQTQQDAYQEYQQFSQPNEAMRILQESLRTATGAKDAPLGKSKIFEQAGVEGHGALSYSLAARSKEMEINQAEFSNIVGKMANNFRDTANNALEKYKLAREDYQIKQAEITAAEKAAVQQEYAIQRMNLQNDMNIDAMNRLSLKERIDLGLPTPELMSIDELAEDTPEYVPPNYQSLLDVAAYDSGVPKQVLASLIQQESGWNIVAANDSDPNRERSYGLGQINLNAHPDITKEQAMDPEFAIPWAAQRLKYMIDKYGLYEGVQAYNTPGAVGSEQLRSYANQILSRVGTRSQQDIANEVLNLDEEQQERSDVLRKELTGHPVYKNMLDIQAGFDTLKVGYQQNNGYGDVAMINGYQRILDPGVSVRGEDIKNLTEAQSILGQLLNTKERVVEGDRLLPKYRDQLLSAGIDQWNTRIDNYDTSIKKQFKQLSSGGTPAVPWEAVGLDFDKTSLDEVNGETKGDLIQKGDAFYKVNTDGTYTRVK